MTPLSERMWSRLQDLYLQWESLGKPGVNQYKLVFDGGKHSVALAL